MQAWASASYSLTLIGSIAPSFTPEPVKKFSEVCQESVIFPSGKPVGVLHSCFTCAWLEVLLTTQVRTQGRRNIHAAIRLLVHFQQGQHNTWRSNSCIVERMDKLNFAILIAIA